MDTVLVGRSGLSPQDVLAVTRHGARVELAEVALTEMARSRRVIEVLASDRRPHYGISTGFGALATELIPTSQRHTLQMSLIRSHAASTGPEVEREVVRGTMLLRLATLATGRTGARPVVAQTYAQLLNAGITPIVGEYGSLGCSGDLAPLAHCALALIGEGLVRDRESQVLPAAEALHRAGIHPVALEEKEGLSLINGTDAMLTMLVLALHDIRKLLATADLAAAMSVEGLAGTDSVFAPQIHALRPHPGQRTSASAIYALLRDSPVISSRRGSQFSRVQDAYSLRCAPQVHGAARDTLDHATTVADRELMSAIDNPAVMPDGRLESNGNFHGAPLGYVLDFLSIATADVASMSERRTDRFLDRHRNGGLPAFLAGDPGVDSGYMIAQYTQAAIVSELKRLAVPASVDSIPTSAMQEDHVSMGWSAARKLRTSIDGLGRVLAIEILAAARGIELRGEGSAAATGRVLSLLRTRTLGPGPDRYLAPEIEEAMALVVGGDLLVAAGLDPRSGTVRPPAPQEHLVA